MKTSYFPALAVGAAVVLAAGPGFCQADPFYKGKRLNVLINYAPGGGTDLEGRFLARSLQRNLEGNPTVIVRNMDGGGGLVGANYLGEVAPRDGLTLGFLSGAAWEAAADPKPRRVPFESYDFVAYQSGVAVAYVRRDVSPGLRTSSDLPNAQGLIVGGLGVNISKDLSMRLTLDMLGIPFKYVPGYIGNNGARLALQTKEINFYKESLPAYRMSIEPSLVQNGEVLAAFYDPEFDGVAILKSMEAEKLGLESFPDYYRRVVGKEPQGDIWEAYKAVCALSITMARLIGFPPHSPPEAIKAVREAFKKMEADPLYQEEALKTFAIVPTSVYDENVGDRIRKALVVTPEMRTWIANYAAKAGR